MKFPTDTELLSWDPQVYYFKDRFAVCFDGVNKYLIEAGERRWLTDNHCELLEILRTELENYYHGL